MYNLKYNLIILAIILNSNNNLIISKKIIAILTYLLVNFILGSLILLMIIGIYSLFSEYSFDFLYNLITKKVEDIPSQYLSVYAITTSITNFITNIIMVIVVFILYKKNLVEDFKSIINNRKLVIFSCLSAIVFFGITYSYSTILLENLLGKSENQLAIEVMIKNGGIILMFFSVVGMAPLVEEIVFRKSIFELLENKPIGLSYAISALAFALPHMLSTSFDDPIKWLLLTSAYLLSGLLLCLIYHKSKYNIWTVWLAHVLNNFISFILIIIL